jgi:hypothetical protein
MIDHENANKTFVLRILCDFVEQFSICRIEQYFYLPVRSLLAQYIPKPCRDSDLGAIDMVCAIHLAPRLVIESIVMLNEVAQWHITVDERQRMR